MDRDFTTPAIDPETVPTRRPYLLENAPEIIHHEERNIEFSTTFTRIYLLSGDDIHNAARRHRRGWRTSPWPREINEDDLILSQTERAQMVVVGACEPHTKFFRER